MTNLHMRSQTVLRRAQPEVGRQRDLLGRHRPSEGYGVTQGGQSQRSCQHRTMWLQNTLNWWY
jgi:hypothetical protein